MMDISHQMRQIQGDFTVPEICELSEQARTLLANVCEGAAEPDEAMAAFHFVSWQMRMKLQNKDLHPDARHLVIKENRKLNDRWRRISRHLATDRRGRGRGGHSG